MKCSLNQKGKVLPPYYLVNKRGYIEISTAMNSKYQDIGKSIMILKQAGAELCQAQVNPNPTGRGIFAPQIFKSLFLWNQKSD